jgi:hypothetical protein
MTKEVVMEFSVKDGVRTLEFDGVKLSESSSREPRKPRWVEFSIYRTPKNQYVISRVGMSIFYHSKECFTVVRNSLSPVDGLKLSGEYVACSTCHPSRGAEEGVFPETPRASAWVCSDAVGVVDSLMKRDDNGTEYLTNVARRLLVEASKLDTEIAGAFYVDRIE